MLVENVQVYASKPKPEEEKEFHLSAQQWSRNQKVVQQSIS